MDNKISRKEFLKMGTRSILTIAAVTACGDVISLAAERGKKPEEITVGENNLITTISGLKDRQYLNFIYKGKKSILLYNEGQIKAFENICTHRGGPTKLNGDRLICQWHGAQFDPLTGEALKGPAPKGSKLTEIPLEEKDNGDIYIRTDSEKK